MLHLAINCEQKKKCCGVSCDTSILLLWHLSIVWHIEERVWCFNSFLQDCVWRGLATATTTLLILLMYLQLCNCPGSTFYNKDVKHATRRRKCFCYCPKLLNFHIWKVVFINITQWGLALQHCQIWLLNHKITQNHVISEQ